MKRRGASPGERRAWAPGVAARALLLCLWCGMALACGSTDQAAPFDPPLLRTRDISGTVTRVEGPLTLPFTAQGASEGGGFTGYTFETRGDAVRLEVTGHVVDGAHVVALYGPRPASGVWGEARASAVGDRTGVALRTQALEAGRYLVLLGTDGGASASHRLTARCEGAACLPPPEDVCPTQPECPLACPDGYVLDDAGCPLCACAVECVADMDCMGGAVCVEGRCEEPCQCPGQLEPVCGTNGETYANACEARCDGVAVAAAGACPQACDEPACDAPCEYGYALDAEGCPSCVCLSACDVCESAWAPVCSFNQRTYPSACQATCRGELVAHLGACDPSCGAFACELTCAHGYRRDVEGCAVCECVEAPACEAAAPAPVCGVDGVSYPTACVAQVRGVAQAYDQTCPGYLCAGPGGCPADTECVTPDSPEACVYNTLTQACMGVCLRRQGCGEGQAPCPAGYGCDAGACEPGCQCPDLFDPVCGDDGVTYDNACVARCQGAQLAKAGRCCTPDALEGCALTSEACPQGLAFDASGCPLCRCRTQSACVCSALDNPVCASWPGSAARQTFGNACEARCQGMTELTSGPCP